MVWSFLTNMAVLLNVTFLNLELDEDKYQNPNKTKIINSDVQRHHPIMVKLLCYQLFLTSTILFLQVWCIFLANIKSVDGGCHGNGGTAPDSTSNDVILELLVRYMSLWAILSLGVYTLLSVLCCVLTLGDRPDAASELTTKISLAKENLRAAGFAF